MKTVYKNVELESKYLGNKNWTTSMFRNRNNHRITVKNLDTGEWTWFEYWESIQEVEIKKEEQLMFAFYCFLSDALAGEMEYYDFCNEYGYDGCEPSSKKVWKACQNSAEKANRLFGPDYVDIMNDVQERWDF